MNQYILNKYFQNYHIIVYISYMNPISKICSKCKTEQPIENFRKQAVTKDGYKYWCRFCDNTYAHNRYQKNKEYFKQWQITWRKNNKHIINTYHRKYYKQPIQRAIRNLRHRIKDLIKNDNDYSTKIGCTGAFLKQYLQSKFQPGMTWENYGFGDNKWHIDHIIPLSSFDLTDIEQRKKANHYTNLQPLWQKDNLSKGSKIII